jgi:hypothetical protein
MFYELIPEAIELGFDAALPAEFTSVRARQPDADGGSRLAVARSA